MARHRHNDSPPLTRSSSQLSTKTLLRRGQAGDPSAFNRLFARLVPRLMRWTHGRLPRGARGMVDTRDVIQDAAFGAWRRADQIDLREPGDLEAYVRQAILNRIRDEARRLDRRPAPGLLTSTFPDDRPSTFEEVVGRELSARYEAASASLTADEREILVARLEFGYSYQQIADLLNKPSPDAARMATVRAVNRLKALVGMTRKS